MAKTKEGKPIAAASTKEAEELRTLRLAVSTAILCLGRKTDDLDPKILTSYTPAEALNAADFLIEKTK